MITDMLKISSNFQTSVNIAYDLTNKTKIKSLIPSKFAVELLERFILSTDDNSTDRAHILIGAYGKGKSHIVLSIISLLCQKDRKLYTALLKKVKEYSADLYEYVGSYLDGDKKLFPVIVNGSSNSIVQSLTNALYIALEQNGLLNIMPETNFKAALNVLERWQHDYPETYALFCDRIDVDIDIFKNRLSQCDVSAYTVFEKLHPSLTAGSQFNPFTGFDVVELYEKVNQQLVSKFGYSGIFIIYDEFGKYLEAAIDKASVNDIKTLQDLAEKCTRSGQKQIHFLLICHKEIQNYIDVLPKNKVDGWRGVAERFSHIVMQNDFQQIYETIGMAITKDKKLWASFCREHFGIFETLIQKYGSSKMFESCDGRCIEDAVISCYPMHPVTTFVLPRISEKIAQNERTLFTFIAGQEKNTLRKAIEKAPGDFPFVTPDALYDYFNQQLRSQPYTSEISHIFKTTESILNGIDRGEILASKIVKTLSIIYCLAHFERLSPTIDTVVDIYTVAGYAIENIKQAISYLTDKQYVLYIKRSNSYLKLKPHNEVDIRKIISETELIKENQLKVTDVLNSFNSRSYFYPTQYNDEKKMTRYFKFAFMGIKDLQERDFLERYISDHRQCDGFIFALFVDNEEDLKHGEKLIKEYSTSMQRVVFAIPRCFTDISKVVYEYDAVISLKERYAHDELMKEEFEIVYQDLSEVLNEFLNGFVYPELGRIKYRYRGKLYKIIRKSQLSKLLSDICEDIFKHTPIINNESLNKDSITSMAFNSRQKLLNGIINNMDVHNLGLLGNGQEISFMRSTLVVPGLLLQDGNGNLVLKQSNDENLNYVLDFIRDFLKSSSEDDKCFQEMYDGLCMPDNGIGLRKGVIPVYLSFVMNEFGNDICIKKGSVELPITSSLLSEINSNPKEYTVSIETWSDNKSAYICGVEEVFEDFIDEEEKRHGGYGYLTSAMSRWYMSLPRYVKERTSEYNGFYTSVQFRELPQSCKNFLNVIAEIGGNTRETLFKKIPECFSHSLMDGTLVDEIRRDYREISDAFDCLISTLVADVKKEFVNTAEDISLGSVLKNWYGSVGEYQRNILYPNNAERLFSILDCSAESDYTIVDNMANMLVGLRICDWKNDSPVVFHKILREYLATIKVGQVSGESNFSDDGYVVVFSKKKGDEKRFNKVSITKRGKLLLDEIETSLDEMGQAISKQEKRQVIMDVLKKLC